MRERTETTETMQTNPFPIRSVLLALLLAVTTTTLFADTRLREGDKILIRLGGVPSEEITAVSGEYEIDGQGYVNLPHIGRIKADGKTQAELQSTVEAQYKSAQIYTNPSIMINVPSQARFVNVGGAVRQSGRIPFTTDLTVLSAITAAGGFNEFADQRKVKLIRGDTVIQVDCKDVRKNPEKDVPLKPGDSIEVPQSFF